jgi:hypothetical protein
MYRHAPGLLPVAQPQALWFTHAQRVRRAFYVTPFLVVLVLLPVSLLTSAMTQLNDLFCSANNTKLRWDDYCYSGMRFFTILRSVLTGFVPALLIQLWQVRIGGGGAGRGEHSWAGRKLEWLQAQSGCTAPSKSSCGLGGVHVHRHVYDVDTS